MRPLPPHQSTPAPPSPQTPPPEVPQAILDFVEPYRPLKSRQYLLIGVLTLVTVVAVGWLMTERPGATRLPGPASAPDIARCAPGQTRDCVGGAILVLPAAAPPVPAASR